MFLICKSYADQSKCLKSLADVCFTIEDKLNLPDYDVRRLTMHNIASIARSATIILNLLNTLCEGNETAKRFIPQISDWGTAAAESIKQDQYFLQKTVKMGFCFSAQSQVENCVVALLKKISGTNEKKFL